MLPIFDCYLALSDALIKSHSDLSFRAEREIFPVVHSEKIRFLPAVEMTEDKAVEMAEDKAVDMTKGLNLFTETPLRISVLALKFRE